MTINYDSLEIERAIRKCRCRECEKIIKKGEKRVGVYYCDTRFGLKRRFYHPLCMADRLDKEIKTFEEKIKLIIKTMGLMLDYK